MWSSLSLQCFENLKSIFLCLCLEFDGIFGIYSTEIDVCVHQTPAGPYFGRNFNTSIIHAVWAMINLLQESVAGGASLTF